MSPEHYTKLQTELQHRTEELEAAIQDLEKVKYTMFLQDIKYSHAVKLEFSRSRRKGTI